MSLLAIKVDVDSAVRGIEGIGAQLPFTIARFLTLSAQSGQAAGQKLARDVFKTRNDWTVRNIRITPATKQTQKAEVFTDTSNRKTGAPDYLPRQQEGGVKVGRHIHVAIPTKYLKRIAPGIIPDALRPKNLLPASAQIGEVFAGSFTLAGPHRAVSRASRKKLGHSEFNALLQYAKTGTLCIFVRHGGVANIGGVADAEPWYVLVREAHVKAIFPMDAAVEKAVQENLDRNFTRAAAEVLVNEALKNGLRVKF